MRGREEITGSSLGMKKPKHWLAFLFIFNKHNFSSVDLGLHSTTDAARSLCLPSE